MSRDDITLVPFPVERQNIIDALDIGVRGYIIHVLIQTDESKFESVST